jgi:hypothetical protein
VVTTVAVVVAVVVTVFSSFSVTVTTTTILSPSPSTGFAVEPAFVADDEGTVITRVAWEMIVVVVVGSWGMMLRELLLKVVIIEKEDEEGTAVGGASVVGGGEGVLVVGALVTVCSGVDGRGRIDVGDKVDVTSVAGAAVVVPFPPPPRVIVVSGKDGEGEEVVLVDFVGEEVGCKVTVVAPTLVVTVTVLSYGVDVGAIVLGLRVVVCTTVGTGGMVPNTLLAVSGSSQERTAPLV